MQCESALASAFSALSSVAVLPDDGGRAAESGATLRAMSMTWIRGASRRWSVVLLLSIAGPLGCGDDSPANDGGSSSSSEGSSGGPTTLTGDDTSSSGADSTTDASVDSSSTAAPDTGSTGATDDTSTDDGTTSTSTPDGTESSGGEEESSTGGKSMACPDGELGPALPDSLFGNTFGEGDDFAGTCGGAGSPDAQYTFTAPADGTYTFDTHGSQLNTVLYVLDGDCTGPELACNDDGDGSQSALAVTLVAGQTVTVVVDGTTANGLPFTLRVQSGSFVCPVGDLGNTVPNLFMGDTTPMFDGNASTCGGQAGRDAPYLFTAPATGTYTFDTFGSSFESVLYVLDGVCSGQQIACGDEGMLVDLVAGQEVTVVVDSQFAWGSFGLNIDTLGGACPDANLGNTVPVLTSGDTTPGDNTESGSCGGGFSNDDLYLFTAPQDGLYQFDTFGSALDTVLYLQNGGCGGVELDCNDDFTLANDESRIIEGLSAGQTVLVGVDGNGVGAYDLSIDLVPCPDEALPSAAPQVLVDTTQNGVDKLAGSCRAIGAANESPDYAYSFTAPADGEYTFDTNGTFFDTVLYVLDGAACNGAELACSDNFQFNQTSALSLQLTAGQTVSVVVDGNFGAQGQFTLNVGQLGGGACPDDTFGDVLPDTVMGNTNGGDNTVAGTCGGFTTADDVYSFTAPMDGSYSFDTIGSSYDTVMFVRDGDCGGPELACNDNISFNSQQSQVLVALAADQTVMVAVDGSFGTGAYALNVQQVTCPDADLGSEFPINGEAGSTIGSVNKINGVNCTSDGGSPDFVYQWTAPASDTYDIDLCGSGYDTYLIVHDAVCGGDELACDDDFCGLQSGVSVDLEAGQTIMISVGGYNGASGNYTLNIN